ncbi:hypothetical protein [Fibrella forsythiae]|uniref:Uncharacterized protein n=1 Tax=Fibrella forsythiae TaxID=2817061 RepID=A0ABS3JBB6_9BACT|nr:hypothetical protein [Fibrella forsythiae]MBO0947288.1 hypothetical protein [Fibrella forsythiae]
MLNFKKTVVNGGVPLFQQVFETAQGGFFLDKASLDPLQRVLPGGTMLYYDESTRKAFVIKSTVLQAAATNADTTYKVLKNHGFKVGDIVAESLKGKSVDITTINTADAAFDVLTLSATLGVALPAGSALYQAKTATAGSAAPLYQPKGLLYEDTSLEGNVEVSVVIRGTTYLRRIPGVPADIQLTMPLIVFSKSY